MAVSLLLAFVFAASENPTVYRGMCDASAGWMVDGMLLAVNDEDQEKTLLRLYDPAGGGAPKRALQIEAGKLNLEQKREEIDLEGLAKVGDLYFAIGSHSRNKEGKKRVSRQRLFAFRIPGAGAASVAVEGSAYETLLADAGKVLKQTIGLEELDLPADPKDGGVSIEGLSATPDGRLLIGFRSPLRGKKAMVATLENPLEVIAGKPAKFGAVHLLDLGGGGVRDMVWSAERKEYLIVAGAVAAGGPFALYGWKGGGSQAAARVMDLGPVTPAGTAPEAIVLGKPGSGQALLLFDEGARPAGGKKECKDLAGGEQSFRGQWIRLPE